ncbi:hypothetical protein B0A48_11305 [Cryoendolithus antarcticus]|uniref:Uncharacterized protein n=1 Tax=Cryoendolithus antarcticus TaxID=1507870 RepID=A0A1V8SVF2_9PEZI|nr:hypothetical protein B0A48_11305 [Cryoendolithus antarcticus]
MDGFSEIGPKGKPVREPAPPAPSEQQGNPTPANPRDAVAGNGLFLGRRAREDQLHYPTMSVRVAGTETIVTEGIFNHPVMVVNRPADMPGVADLCVITSLHNVNIQDVRSDKAFASHIPLAGASHPHAQFDSRYAPLTFINGARFDKPSSVNAGRILRVDFELLETHKLAPTSLNALKLTDESLQRLLSICKDLAKS